MSPSISTMTASTRFLESQEYQDMVKTHCGDENSTGLPLPRYICPNHEMESGGNKKHGMEAVVHGEGIEMGCCGEKR